MTIVVSHKQRIHFAMEGERGAFLILHHGLFGSHQDWRRAGYAQALGSDFRLILPDARGHGRSDRPAEREEYALARFSDDLVTVMNELDIRNAHFVGYSLGALVGLDLVMRHPERVRLIMLGGEAPAVTAEARDRWRQWSAQIRERGLAAWMEAERGAGRLVAGPPPGEEAQVPALALLEAMADWEESSAEQFQVGSPITIFSAGDDPAFARTQQLARKFQRARFIPFPGRTHAALFEQREVLLESMLRFIRITRRPGEGAPGERRERPGEEAAEAQAGGQGRGPQPWQQRDGEPPAERPWQGESRETAWSPDESVPAGEGGAAFEPEPPSGEGGEGGAAFESGPPPTGSALAEEGAFARADEREASAGTGAEETEREQPVDALNAERQGTEPEPPAAALPEGAAEGAPAREERQGAESDEPEQSAESAESPETPESMESGSGAESPGTPIHTGDESDEGDQEDEEDEEDEEDGEDEEEEDEENGDRDWDRPASPER